MKIRMGFELEDSMSVQKTLSEVVDFEDIANFAMLYFLLPMKKQVLMIQSLRLKLHLVQVKNFPNKLVQTCLIY